MPERVRVGVVGCGNVSLQYLKNAASFPILEIVALADRNRQCAMDRAREFDLRGVRMCTADEVMADPAVEVVLNLTWPKEHLPVSLAAIEAGKHVFSEKPLGVGLAEGRKVMEAAGRKGVRVGCAPDTFLGAGIQTARKVVDSGQIGRPVAFTAFMMHRGVETWHPNPLFYYEPGGGPMLDMGPYYLTALMNMLGPVKRITGAATIAIPERTITHRDREGKPGAMFGRNISVATADHICGTIEFENGCTGVIMTSFATHFPNYDGRQPITIYGSEGTLRVPDPNAFDGPVHMRREGDAEWSEVPHAFVTGYGRAVGLADMAYAIRSGRKHRASGEQALAVLEILEAFVKSAESGRALTPTLRYERPAAMVAGLPFGTLDT